MHFFLQGERGIGKSYLLRQHLLPYLGQMAGFGVSRLTEDGEVAGFAVYDVKAGFGPLEQEGRAGSRGSDEDVFMYRGHRDITVLEKTIARVAADCREAWCRLIYLDEIGGIELVSPAFLASLGQVLACGKPCIGVWKSAANLSHTLQNYGLSGEYRKQHRQLEEQLTAAGELHTLTAGNQKECQKRLAAYLSGRQQEYGREELR